MFERFNSATPRTRILMVITVSLFLIFIFLRFYKLGDRLQFTWDQVQNSWVMKNMIVDHKMPLEGMVAKLNTGFHIGPAYFYLLAPFYWVFGLDPIAGGVFAGSVAIVSVVILFIVLLRLSDLETAVMWLGIYTFSYHTIVQDRIAWPVIFIPVTSGLIFFSLYRVVSGKIHYLPLLATVLGFSLHVHFTSIFYFVITLLCLPFIVRYKKFWKYFLVSLPFFFIWTIPFIVAGLGNKFSSGSSILSYLQGNYQGFHLVRVFQLIGDALIEFQSVVRIPAFNYIKYFIFPLFIILYLNKNRTREGLLFCYLLSLWLLVPLILLSAYKGEISDYYFALTRPLVVAVYAYITVECIKMRYMWLTILLGMFWLYFVFYNVHDFSAINDTGYLKERSYVRNYVKIAGYIGFSEGDPDSYLYYVYKNYQK